MQVAHREGLELVVRDEQRRGAGLRDDAAQLWARRSRRSTSRLENGSSSSSNRGAGRQRPRQRDALLLAAGELVRRALAACAETDQIEHLACARAWRRGRQADAEGTLSVHAQVREQRVVLEHHADAAPFQGWGGRRRRRQAARHRHDAPVASRSRPGHRAQQRGLAPQPEGPISTPISPRQRQRNRAPRLGGCARVAHRRPPSGCKHGDR